MVSTRLTACNGDTPIYKTNYKGVDVAFYLTAICSAMASSMCYETNWLTGATRFIMFGSCGSLDRKKRMVNLLSQLKAIEAKDVPIILQNQRTILK